MMFRNALVVLSISFVLFGSDALGKGGRTTQVSRNPHTSSRQTTVRKRKEFVPPRTDEKRTVKPAPVRHEHEKACPTPFCQEDCFCYVDPDTGRKTCQGPADGPCTPCNKNE